MPVGSQHEQVVWMKAVCDVLHELNQVDEMPLINIDDQDLDDAVQEFWDEYAEALEVWRTAMECLSNGSS